MTVNKQHKLMRTMQTVFFLLSMSVGGFCQSQADGTVPSTQCLQLIKPSSQSTEISKEIKVPPLEKSLLLHGQAPLNIVPLEPALKIFIWNVKKMKGSKTHDFLHRWVQQADLTLIQEAGYGSTTNDFWNKINPASALWSFAVSYKQKGLTTGVLTRSIFHPLKQKILRSRGREVLKKSHKMSLLTYLPIEGREEPLLVINLHALNFVSLGSYTKQVDRLLEYIKPHQGPIVVGGDFNSYTWQRNKRLLNRLSPLGIKEVKIEGRKTIWPWKLDRVFTRGFQVQKAYMMHESEGSDHEALWVELKFNTLTKGSSL